MSARRLTVRISRLAGADPSLALPAYRTDGAAGMDLPANLRDEHRAHGIILAPGERTLVPTGLAVELPPGYELQLRPRSGLALAAGVTLLNSPGTIDCDYRGEIGVIVVNLGSTPFKVEHGMRIAQMVVAPVSRVVWEETGVLGATERGSGGYGSTGTG